MSSVYLLCFAPGIRRDERANVRHYCGFTEQTPEARLAEHLAGRGSPLVAAVVRAGIDVELVRTWPDESRTFERRLKRRRNLPDLCPRCRP